MMYSDSDTIQTSMSGSNKMVLTTPTVGFFTNTLDNMEKMRDETWSDIILKVGCRLLYAHRLVLGAHSGYFKTLFHSNFADSKSKEIDLSPVVTEADILEILIRYMYCGKIECEKKDILEVARLASYLEMENLMSICEKWMIKHVTLSNCVEYYIFANTCGYRKIENISYKIIEQRFHDYIVFQDSALDLKPKDLILMLDSGFFKNCGSASFLEFLGNWVAKGGSDMHVEVAKEILEYLDQELESDFIVTAHKTPMNSLEECCKNLQSKLNTRDTKVDKEFAYSFLTEFQRLVFQIKEAKEIPIEDVENVVFALCERKKKPVLVSSEFRFASSRGAEEKEQNSVYDIYLFREHSKCWYHIDTIESYPNYCSKKTLPFYRKNNNCFVLNKTLVFVGKNSKHAMKFNLGNKEWSEFELPSVQGSDEGLSDIGNEFAVCNDELYVVFTKTDAEPFNYRYYHEDNPIDIHGCFFQIYKVNIQNGSLTLISTTNLYPVEYDQFGEDSFRGYQGIRSSAHVKINEASGDMLVLVYLDEYLGDGCEVFDKFISFVVNLKDGSTHFFSTKTNSQLNYPFHDLYIVEMGDCFLIIRHLEEAICEIIAEYKFLSKEIVFRDGISKPDPEGDQSPCEVEPNEGKLYHGGGVDLLYFYKDSDYNCNLKYISVREDAEKENANGDKKIEQNFTGDKIFKEDGTEDTNAGIDTGKTSESSVNGNRNADANTNKERNPKDNNGGSNDKGKSNEENETQIRGMCEIPLPFTNVKCVCPAKIGKEFISKLEPVKMFLV